MSTAEERETEERSSRSFRETDDSARPERCGRDAFGQA